MCGAFCGGGYVAYWRGREEGRVRLNEIVAILSWIHDVYFKLEEDKLDQINRDIYLAGRTQLYKADG